MFHSGTSIVPKKSSHNIRSLIQLKNRSRNYGMTIFFDKLVLFEFEDCIKNFYRSVCLLFLKVSCLLFSFAVFSLLAVRNHAFGEAVLGTFELEQLLAGEYFGEFLEILSLDLRTNHRHLRHCFGGFSVFEVANLLF